MSETESLLTLIKGYLANPRGWRPLDTQYWLREVRAVLALLTPHDPEYARLREAEQQLLEYLEKTKPVQARGLTTFY
jgi:hypothetical protein